MGSSGVWHRFGLAASPFATSPPAMPFTDGPFRQPFARLIAAIDARASLVLVTGPAGGGRTTLAAAAVAASHRAEAAASLPAEAADTAAALVHWLLARLGESAEATDPADAGRRLLQTIASPGGARAAPLIVIDDLEAVSAAAFEVLMGLLAAAAGRTPPLSALLIAEPDLAIEVAKAATATLPPTQIAEIAVPALGIEGTAAYVAQRLETAGYRGAPPFTNDALIRIANLSRGLPLRINRLCEACFDGASPAALPLGSDVVVAALASSLPVTEDGAGRMAPPQAPGAAQAASPAAKSHPDDEDEDAQEHARLERLAGRVNAAMHRSFKTRVAELAAPREAIAAEVPRHTQLPPPPAPRPPSPPTPPAPAVTAHPPEPAPRRSRPAFAIAVVLLIAGAGAAIGWLTVGDWRALLTALAPHRSPPPATVVEAPPASAAPAASSAPAQPAEAEPAPVPVPPTATAAPAADPAPSPLPAEVPLAEATPQDAAQLMARGETLMRQADIAAAQLFFRTAAEQGSAAGALALAASFDPLVLRDSGVRGARGNPGEALAWYRRAAELGEATAEPRRDRLIDYLRKAAAGGDPAARATLDIQR